MVNPTGLETRYLPIDQQQWGKPNSIKKLLYVFIEWNPGIALSKIFEPLKFDEILIILSTPKIFSRKANNSADDVNHINIHLPISTNKNIGRNAINW